MSTAETSGPHRTLALLWGGSERRRPGPKPGLDRERVVRASVEVADREGMAALTMRRVAAELGIGTASLYTYVPARQDLVALMVDAVAGDSRLPHTFPGGWREKFQAWAREDWAEYHRHPWLLQVAPVSLVPGPNLLAWYDSALHVLGGTGLSELEKVTAIETLDSYIRGLAASTIAGATTEEADGVDDEAWDARRSSALTDLIDFSRFPALLGALQVGVIPFAVDTFEPGLQCVLDGIERLINERSDGSVRP